MKKQIRKIIKESYFDKHMSLAVACIDLIGSSLFVTAVVGIGIFLFLGVISLIISFILSLVGIIDIIDRMLQISSIISIVGGLACCMAYGATKGVEFFKDYLRLPFNELEDALNNLSIEEQGDLKEKINTYIYKSINESISEKHEIEV